MVSAAWGWEENSGIDGITASTSPGFSNQEIWNWRKISGSKEAERVVVTMAGGLPSFPLFCPCLSAGQSPAGLLEMSVLMVTDGAPRVMAATHLCLVVRGGTDTSTKGAASHVME